jgi:hypothetical protein
MVDINTTLPLYIRPLFTAENKVMGVLQMTSLRGLDGRLKLSRPPLEA